MCWRCIRLSQTNLNLSQYLPRAHTRTHTIAAQAIEIYVYVSVVSAKFASTMSHILQVVFIFSHWAIARW